jgi:hypothetical protein
VIESRLPVCPVESQLTRMLVLEFGAIQAHSSASQTSDEHRARH